MQAVDLIGIFSISSGPEIEESGLTQGHDADGDGVLLSTSGLSEFEKLNKNNNLVGFRNSLVAVLSRKSQELLHDPSIHAGWPKDENLFDQILHQLPLGSTSTTTIAGVKWYRNVAANPNADIDLLIAAIQEALPERI